MCLPLWMLTSEPYSRRYDVVGPGAHVFGRLPLHRAQSDVSPPGRRERDVRQARHRESREETQGEARRTRQSHHGDYHQRGAPDQVRHDTAHARRKAAGTYRACVRVWVCEHQRCSLNWSTLSFLEMWHGLWLLYLHKLILSKYFG